mmetsp:Transcript_71364/g.212871  ORF Transcript_71364/g.212871 Transcript_71364/m.212871 type:complete len:273 (+) Transcript_71364:1371-2189(+)
MCPNQSPRSAGWLDPGLRPAARRGPSPPPPPCRTACSPPPARPGAGARPARAGACWSRRGPAVPKRRTPEGSRERVPSAGPKPSRPQGRPFATGARLPIAPATASVRSTSPADLGGGRRRRRALRGRARRRAGDSRDAPRGGAARARRAAPGPGQGGTAEAWTPPRSRPSARSPQQLEGLRTHPVLRPPRCTQLQGSPPQGAPWLARRRTRPRNRRCPRPPPRQTPRSAVRGGSPGTGQRQGVAHPPAAPCGRRGQSLLRRRRPVRPGCARP